MILITGATGGIGSELCMLLAREKIPARAMCRREQQLNAFRTLGLEAILADFDNQESLTSAMRGCEQLFLLTSPTPEHTSREIAIIDRAVEAGVKHILRISTADTNLSARLSYARSHAEIDHYLRSRPVDWTILRPTGFMQNFLESKHAIAKGMLPHSMENGQISYIDLRDIALVAKHILTEGTHSKATYYLTGPASLTVAQVAAAMTGQLGYQIKALQIAEPEMRRQLSFAGLSDWHIGTLIDQFAIGASGGEIDVTEEVGRLTGQPARSFSQFLHDYQNEFLKH